MDFTLYYKGPLETNDGVRVRQKHAMRRAFHPQLCDLVRLPAWSQHFKQLCSVGPDRGEWCLRRRVGAFEFIALISEAIGLFAEVDVRLLRPSGPGRIVHPEGDIDNQLKVLFDALRPPTNTKELPQGESPTAEEEPLFLCVLDDDLAIRRISVQSERLLGAESQDQVVVLIRVSVHAAQRHGMHQHLIG
jgi:hypothetical protein